jgi:hypothetical protein
LEEIRNPFFLWTAQIFFFVVARSGKREISREEEINQILFNMKRVIQTIDVVEFVVIKGYEHSGEYNIQLN